MKKALLTALITVTIFACQEELDIPKTKINYGRVIFYTSKPEEDKQWEVYIDSSHKGLVPYTITEPDCSYDTNPGVVGLHVSLEVGMHTVLLKSLQGFASREQALMVHDGCQTFK
jgi:hypothetical protein